MPLLILILDLQYLLTINMSHLRDIQKLRQTRNTQQIVMPSRFSQPSPIDIYNINFDRIADIQSRGSSNTSDAYNKFLQTKQINAKVRQKKSIQKRGTSNGTISNQKSQLLTPGLSIYNFSLKLSQKPQNSITSRRDKHVDAFQFDNGPTIFSDRGNFKNIQIVQQINEISVKDFSLIYPIGKGGFGKVWKVETKKSKQIFAMKQMYKAKIIQKKSINSVMNERNLLAKIRHPFYINMNYAFQDRENLYLIMDYVDGGDLRYHIGKRRRFNEIETKFFIANLIVGLQYLHKNKIIHRDIKPENLVLDSHGYIKITDLGISREFKEQNHQDTSGTPGYMAPQVMCRKNHSYPVDYFAVGVMAYQFMLGRRPYLGKNRKQIRDQILSKQVMIKPEQIPNRWSFEAADYINKVKVYQYELLQRNPNNRLGTNGIEELKRHEWMKTVDFGKIERMEIKAPYIPMSIQDNYDDYKQQISEDTVDDNLEQNLLMLRNQEVQSLFQGYEFLQNENNDRRKKTSYTTYSTQAQYRKQIR